MVSSVAIDDDLRRKLKLLAAKYDPGGNYSAGSGILRSARNRARQSGFLSRPRCAKAGFDYRFSDESPAEAHCGGSGPAGNRY